MTRFETHGIRHLDGHALIPMNERFGVQPEEDGPIYIELYEEFEN